MMTDTKTPDPEYNHLTDPLRNKRITASIVGAILGNNPYMTRADAMRSMVRDALGAEREFTGNIATDYGNRSEAGAIIDFEMETGLDVAKSKFVTKEDWAGCSPDGIASDEWGLETKCPFSLRKAEAPVPFKTLEDQPHYYDQVQFSLWVTGREGWYFAQWAPNGFWVERVWPDTDWQDDALPKLRQFYAEFLAELESPDDHLAPKRVSIDTPKAAKMVREWDELSEQADFIKERKADLLAEMVEMAKGRNADFAGRRLTLTTKAGAVSYKKALDHYAPNADTSKFTGKPSKFWGLR